MKRSALIIGGGLLAVVVLLTTIRFAPWLRIQSSIPDPALCPEGAPRPCGPVVASSAVNPVGECADNKDNDNDGRTDKSDPGCFDLKGASSLAVAMQESSRYQANGREAREPNCADNRDGDNDGLTDSDDPNCRNAALEYDFRLTELGTACGDGKDNDNDGRTDADDASCREKFDPREGFKPAHTSEGSEAECADGQDNDQSGGRDDQDLGCYDLGKLRGTNGAPDTPAVKDSTPEIPSLLDFRQAIIGNANRYRPNRDTEIGEPGCTNGHDDDGDKAVDDQDTGCGAGKGTFYPFGQESGGGSCDDTIDNDGDDLRDALDPGCHVGGHISGAYDSTRNERQHKQCSDGVDNEVNSSGNIVGDNRTDSNDPGCHLGNNPAWPYIARDNKEAGERQCVDGQDNDGDGLRDGADPHCYRWNKIGTSTRWLWLDNKEAP